jgi:hypothetical protein
MTEAEWDYSAAPLLMMDAVPATLPRRKLILFAVACCRRLGPTLRRPSALRLLDVAEQLADGALSPAAFHEALTTAVGEHLPGGRNHRDRSGLVAIGLLRAFAGRAPDPSAVGPPPRSKAPMRAALREAQNHLAHLNNPGTTFDAYDDARTRELRYLADVLRDLVGPLFRSVAAEAGCRSPTVLGLARSASEERAFDRLPILADALQDAGCADGDVLGHCRGRGPHVRGCWVVDLLLAGR